MAKLLISNGASAAARERNGLQTPLHLSAVNCYVRTARVLLEGGGADVNAVNKISQTPLLYACAEGHRQMGEGINRQRMGPPYVPCS